MEGGHHANQTEGESQVYATLLVAPLVLILSICMRIENVIYLVWRGSWVGGILL